MQKTFNIENMETYFQNYVPCESHRKEPITNFCTQRACLRFLCPECVEEHSHSHANHPVQSIKTCIRKTSDQLCLAVNQLQKETSQNAFLSRGNHQQFSKRLIFDLEELRKKIVEQINSYFMEKENQIRRETSKYQTVEQELQRLRKEIYQAIKELKMLEKKLFSKEDTVIAIKKANSINYHDMILHFRQKVAALQAKMSIQIQLQMNPNKKQEFRQALNHLLYIKNTGNNFHSHNRYNNTKYSPDKPLQPKVLKDPHQINPLPISADRLLNQRALIINEPNFFSGEPFLHFFQPSNAKLHILRLFSIRQNEPVRWDVIPLRGDAEIPYFHRTVATEEGNIYVIGGSIPVHNKKSRAVYQYQPYNQMLREVSSLHIARSSHSLICHCGKIYIMGGINQNDQVLQQCEVFDPNTNETMLIAPSKYATTNSCVCSLGKDRILKLGGVSARGQNSDSIQLYDPIRKLWDTIDPTVESSLKSEFGLLSCSGWCPLNREQVFVFGGYNEEKNYQSSKMSFVIEYDRQAKEYLIKHINTKNLPIAEGFWNPQGIIYNGKAYCLQNVDGEDNNDCLEGQRNLLIFNGIYWAKVESSK